MQAPNVVAAHMLSGQAARAQAALKEMRLSARDSYEIAYNSACAAIEGGQHDSAQDLLVFSDTRGQETLYADGCSEEVCLPIFLSVLADIPVRSPRKSFIFIIKYDIYGIEVSQNVFVWF